MRAFFSINLPNESQVKIADFICVLKNKTVSKNIRWEKSENLHITLRFLGDINQEQYDCITAKIAKIFVNFDNFSISLEKIKLFPSPEKPTALVLTVEPFNLLSDLVLKINEVVVGCGIAADRRKFLPHVTLARLKNADFTLPVDVSFSAVNFLVNEVKLMQSVSRQEFSVYSVLNSYSLAGNIFDSATLMSRHKKGN